MTRQVRITKRDFLKFGYKDRCPSYLDMQAGIPRLTAHHTEECRLRIDLSLYDANDATWKSIERRFPNLRNFRVWRRRKSVSRAWASMLLMFQKLLRIQMLSDKMQFANLPGL